MNEEQWITDAENVRRQAIEDEYTEYATIRLPDGRIVDAKCKTGRDGDGMGHSYGYFLTETLELQWHDPLGAIAEPKLSLEEQHEVIDGEFLHEWILSNWYDAQWSAES